MAVSHSFTSPNANWTGTVTVFNSAGVSTTAAASAIIQPQHWNSVHNEFFTLSGNTNNASTVSGTNIVLQGAGAVTLTGSSNSIIFNDGASNFKQLLPHQYVPKTVSQVGQGQSTLHIQPFTVPFPGLQHDRLGLSLQYSNATNSSNSVSISVLVGVYSSNASTLSLVSSTSSNFAVTNSGTVGIYSSVGGGPRLATIPWTNTLTGGNYWLGMLMATATGGGAGMTVSQWLVTSAFPASTFSGVFSQLTNSTVQPGIGMGIYSVQTAGMPASIGFNQIYNSATLHNMPPVFMLQSGTA